MTNLVVDTPLDDVLGEGVQEVVFPTREFLSSAECTLRRPVLTFSVVLVAGEVVLVLLQHVPRIQLGVSIVISDGQIVLDAEIDSSGIVAGCVLDGNLDLADEMEFPTVAVPYGSNLLDVLHGYVRSRLVLYKDEVRAVVLQVEALAQAELVVLDVVFDAVLFPRYGGAWVFVASLAVAGWIRVCVTVRALFELAVERLSKLF